MDVSTDSYFWTFVQTPVAQAVIWCSVALALSLVGFFLIQKVRNRKNDNDDGEGPLQQLDRFRKMNREGALREDEFQRIRRRLGAEVVDRVQQERDVLASSEETTEASSPPKSEDETTSAWGTPKTGEAQFRAPAKRDGR